MNAAPIFFPIVTGRRQALRHFARGRLRCSSMPSILRATYLKSLGKKKCLSLTRLGCEMACDLPLVAEVERIPRLTFSVAKALERFNP